MTSVSHKRPKCELLVERPREHLNTHDCACALFRISSKRLCTAAFTGRCDYRVCMEKNQACNVVPFHLFLPQYKIILKFLQLVFDLNSKKSCAVVTNNDWTRPFQMTRVYFFSIQTLVIEGFPRTDGRMAANSPLHRQVGMICFSVRNL